MLRWSDEQGGVLVGAVFLFGGLLALLLITLCGPALLNQHRQMRLAVDNAGDAANQVLQAPIRAWISNTLANKASRFYQEVGSQLSTWASNRWNAVYSACMSKKGAKEDDCSNKADQSVTNAWAHMEEVIRSRVASSMFPQPQAALQALARGNPPDQQTFVAEVTPKEAGCGVQGIATAYRGEMETVARAYARANGAEDIEEFQLQTLPDRVQLRFYAVRAIRLPIFTDRTGPGDKTKALGIDNFVRLLSLPLDNTGPCP